MYVNRAVLPGLVVLPPHMPFTGLPRRATQSEADEAPVSPWMVRELRLTWRDDGQAFPFCMPGEPLISESLAGVARRAPTGAAKAGGRALTPGPQRR